MNYFTIYKQIVCVYFSLLLFFFNVNTNGFRNELLMNSK